MSIDLRSLIGRLSNSTRRALEGAAGLAMSHTHYEVEVEHWLEKLLEESSGDLPKILRDSDVEPDRFLGDLNLALNTMKTGNGRRPDLSQTIEQLSREAWVLSSINYNLGKVRSGAIFLAALNDKGLRRRLIDVHRPIENINVEALEKDFLSIVEGSAEDGEVGAIGAGTTQRDLAQPGTAGAGGKTPALDQFTVDVTAQARAGEIDPILGRDAEIRQIIDILSRRKQNNPILTGEAGVGKTAVVEGFALKIVAGEVPDTLLNVSLRSLDMGLLQAGAGVKGEFENRLKQVIEEVQSSATPIILFIDEAHTLIGAGGAEGQNDAANLLKPALARGQLRTVAATTWAEYKKYFEKDPALTRRFQVIKVEEPGEDDAIQMMRGLTGMLENHHGIRILDEAVVDSVRLSHRYIPARQLPDKSVSVLDTACGRVAVGQRTIPAAIEDLRARITNLDREKTILVREEAIGNLHGDRLAEIEVSLASEGTELAALEARWENEKTLVSALQEIRGKLEAGLPGSEEEEGAAPLTDAERTAVLSELEAKREELTAAQGEDPLVLYDVDSQAVAEVISSWTGIPIGKMVADEIRTIIELPKALGERVIGQDHALEAIARRIRTSRAQLDNPSRPIGVFMLAGPSGVGKTETAMALADTLYGGERNSVIINMSEYQESHTVSSLKGAPPGYVGYGEGGVLTEAVRRRPYSVVLLDEVEKAHPDVMELFFQVFDKGMLEDGEGRDIDFRNCVILLTSNVGTDTIINLCADPETRPEPEAMADAIRPELLEHFPAALIGRLVVIPYYSISEEMLITITKLQLKKIIKRFKENHGADLVAGEDIVSAVVERCNDTQSGARAVDQILTNSLLPQMSAHVLESMASGTDFKKIVVSVGEGGEFEFSVS
ncbi:MAG: type VI secretion system protein VasG [Myxococcota bacterium]|jgi:type VI secretion system protein VasG